MRWVKTQASRGSRPLRMISMPRNIVDDDQASLTFPPSTSASIRRCPSMRVTGSTTPWAILSILGAAIRNLGLDSRMVQHELSGAMGSRRNAHDCRRPQADFVEVGAHLESVHIRQAPIERRHGVPEVRLRTTDTWMAAPDGPVRALIPSHFRAVLRGRWTFASHLVETSALPMGFIAPSFDVLSSVEVSAPFAVVMDEFPVREKRTSVPIQRRPLLHRHVVNDQRRNVFGVHRACRHVDQVLEARHCVADRNRAGRIRTRRRYPA